MMLAFSAFIMMLSTALGYQAWAVDPALAKTAIDQIINTKFTTIVEQMLNAGWWEQVIIIFVNNLKASALIMISGIFLPIFPLLMGIMPNGFMIGLMAGFFEVERLLSKSAFFLSLLPHGFFEMPAILLTATVGTIWGGRNWRSIFTGESVRKFGVHAKTSLTYLPLIILLLLIAALVEVLVTPHIYTLPRFA
jgi:stage II sporulation protein M